MIRHIVWWELKEEANGKSAEQNAAELVAASAMLQGVASALSVEVSNKIERTSTEPAQVILMSTHNDMNALEAYKLDPIHVKFAQLVTAAAAKRSCVDYVID